MQLVVIEKTMVAHDVVRVRLEDPEGHPLPAAPSGGHLPVVLPNGSARRYSLTSPSDASYREITVLRANPSGGGSSYIHDKLSVGDLVETKPPENGFPLSLGAHHGVFIAGGIGITPFLTMIPALRAADGTYQLHYTVRDNARRVPLPRPLEAVNYADDGSAPKFNVNALLDGIDREAHLYVCGPRGLIEAVRLGAAARGWPPVRVHFESFGAAPRNEDRPVNVRLFQTGNTLMVEPGTTILEAMLIEGVWASYQCRRGTCGQCYTPVLSGDVDHRDLCLTPEQRQTGMCACISWAISDEIVLDL